MSEVHVGGVDERTLHLFKEVKGCFNIFLLVIGLKYHEMIHSADNFHFSSV